MIIAKKMREKGRVLSVYFKIVGIRGKRVTPSFRQAEIFRRNYSEMYYLVKVKVLVILF